MIRLAVAGAAGKMGRTILSLAAKDKEFKITGAFESPESPALGTDAGLLIGRKAIGVAVSHYPFESLNDSDVLIDFTHPSTTDTYLRAALKAKVAYVLGTTGLNAKIMTLITKVSHKIPVVQSPNMSIGVNLLFRLAEITAKALDETYDIEISETHHRMKKDAPSGTAVKLLEVVAKTRKRNLQKDVVTGRDGETGARPEGQIGVLAMRGGDVVGDHTVFFFGDGERIELTHRASSRDAFAQGALRAAKFVAKRKNGLYNMQQVLGLET
jgi:4-hydroxy-tetrahydrodipicolinate reductase